MVDTDEMVIRGHQIGLDQSTDQAWVQGNGSLTQMASRGFFSDKGLNSQKAPEPREKEKDKDKDARIKPAADQEQGQGRGRGSAEEDDADDDLLLG